jgi:L-asparaginase
VAPTFPAETTTTRVVVIGLGGTIAMKPAVTGGVTPSLSPQQLVDAAPGLTDTGVALEVVAFRSRPGASLIFDDILELVPVIRAHLTGGAAGVVITQGTDTIEETAYVLDLLHHLPEPVVVTGAMRHPAMAGADGPANLLAAVQVAASPQTRDLGCVVVLGDEIHAAARVGKTHSTSPSAFKSRNGGPLGYVVEGVPTVLNRPASRQTVPLPSGGRQPRVGLYTAALGDDGTLIADFARTLDGLVVAGFGVGHVPDTWVQVLSELTTRMPVVLASRIGAGSVLTSTYGFAGSERDLIACGLIPAGLLDPYKSRILLHLAVAAGADRAAIADAFRVAARS